MTDGTGVDPARQFICSEGHVYAAGRLEWINDVPYCPMDMNPCTPYDTVAPVPAAAPSAGARPTVSGARVLELRFEGYTVLVPLGRRALLGRDPAYSDHAGFLGGFPGVSRRHAVLGLGRDGNAWIQDEYALNGLMVNAREVAPGGSTPLHGGERVRLCVALAGEVVLSEEGDDDVGPDRAR